MIYGNMVGKEKKLKLLFRVEAWGTFHCQDGHRAWELALNLMSKAITDTDRERSEVVQEVRWNREPSIVGRHSTSSPCEPYVV